MHPASSASNFKWELKNMLSFCFFGGFFMGFCLFFCQCNLNPFTDLQKKKVIIKKNAQIFPITTIQLKGSGGNHQ